MVQISKIGKKMTKNIFFFDLTRHKGSAQRLISSARAYAQACPAAVTEWLVSPYQRVDVASLEGTVHQVVEYDVSPFLEKRLHELNGNSMTGITAYIFSHSGYVISRAEALKSPGWIISAESFRTLLHPVRSGSAAEVTGTMSV